MARHPYVGAHFSLMVESIEKTVEYMRKTVGVEFGAPASIPFVMKGQGVQYEQVVRACYAKDRHVELVDAADRGPFDRSLGFGLHHYGGVVSDLEAAVADQRSHGNAVAWELSYEGQLIAVFFEGVSALPGRLEFVTGSAPPLLEVFAERT